MVLVSLQCVVVGVAGDAFTVDIDKNLSVGHLKDKIVKENKNYPTLKKVAPKNLLLFLAKAGDSAWLATNTDDVKRLMKGEKTPFIEALTHEEEALAQKLRGPYPISDYLNDMDDLQMEQIHVLVVVPQPSAVNRETTRDEDLPCAKRAKLMPLEVTYRGPVPEEFYSVPMETIDTYQRLEATFLSERFARPLCLLYGPRQFGKTTIGHRLWSLLAADPSILVIYRPLTPSIVETEETFWLALGRFIGENTRSSQEFQEMISRRKTRLWLVIDDMDTMFENEKLTSNFMHRLRMWQTSRYFFGFLGIGSHDVMEIPSKVKGGGPFNLCEAFQVEPFSTDQMNEFFEQIKTRYRFGDSVRQAIMEYSAGAPGVFGSLVRYSIDSHKCNQERHEWEHWFKIQHFSFYLKIRRWTFKRQQDLCLEALPVREVSVVATADDPLELFAVSLEFVDPETIRHIYREKLAPCESVFQFELYASIREIFKASNIPSENVLAEARHYKQNQRLDIIINNGVNYGYELKSNQLTETEMTAAVKEADDSRQLLDISKMFLVNFVPRSHSLQLPVYTIEKYPDVKIIHVFFPDTCDEYTLQLEGADGVIETRTVRCA
ncbi:hypothetical protein DVH05_003740 [Phytophthora capsici]|nr:hypothetical protein DVH05_003740 [Phytophthora capsici]